jgi:hypothetical protein
VAYPDLPHIAAPFTFGPGGVTYVVEQDSPHDIAGCVYNIVVCPVGFLPYNPGFGIDDPSFVAVPIDTTRLVAEIAEQEPRASLAATEFGDQLNEALRTIVLQVAATTVERGGAGQRAGEGQRSEAIPGGEDPGVFPSDGRFPADDLFPGG